MEVRRGLSLWPSTVPMSQRHLGQTSADLVADAKTIKLRFARSIARICTCVICLSSVSATMALDRHHTPMSTGGIHPPVQTVVLDPLNRSVANRVGL